MTPASSLCFVQFLHPGGEHHPDTGFKKSWNRGSHARKFLLSPGHAIRGSELKEGDLVFWGEWEPESEVVEQFQDHGHGDPSFLWRPYFSPPTKYAGLQNTDPFVFGSFLYGICRQHRKTGPTALQRLGRGSVILFGSSLGGSFVLDTVFVVKDWIDHTESSYREVLNGRVPREYVEVAIRPLYESGRRNSEGCTPDDRSWRLYQGASAEEPLDGMFSFVPCLPYTKELQRFRRPIIQDDRFVSDASRTGFRMNPQSTIEDVVQLWRSVVDRVHENGLRLGVQFQMPERREHAPTSPAPSLPGAQGISNAH